MNATTSMDSEPPADPGRAEKKPYSAPRLTTHGNVSELTLGTKSGTLPDVESSGSHTPGLM